MKTALKRTLAIVIPFAVCFGVLELFARTKVDPLPYRRPPQVRYDPHPVRTFTLRPCQQGVYTLAAPVEIDCDGMRTDGRNESTGGAGEESLRILAVGDSFTFGWGVAGHETWPAQLERQLEELLDRPVDVQNAGTISYGVFQELDLIRERLERDPPDWIVHALYWNDYQSAQPPKEGAPSVLTDDGYLVWEPEATGTGAMRRTLDWLTARSSFVTFLRLAFGSRLDAGDGGYGAAYHRFVSGAFPTEEFAPVEAFYRDLAALADEHDVRVLSILLPVVDLLGVEHLGHPYPDWVADTLARFDIPGVDGLSLWHDRGYGRDLFLSEGADAHLAPEGYRRLVEPVAERMAAELRR